MKKIFLVMSSVWLLGLAHAAESDGTESANVGEAAEGAAAPCAKSFYREANYVKVHKLKNGMEIQLCGREREKTGELQAELFVRQADGTMVKQEGLALGETSDAYGPFSAKLVKVDFKSDGLRVLDFIPVAANEYVPAFERRVICSKDECKVNKAVSCRFRRLDSTQEPAATKQVKRFARGKGMKPRDDILMDTYRNALSGNRTAANALLDPGFLRRMKASMKDEPGAMEHFAFAQIESTLRELKKKKCLR